jgi:hypothetical protein
MIATAIGLAVLAGSYGFVYMLGKESGRRHGNPAPIRLPSGKVVEMSAGTIEAFAHIQGPDDALAADDLIRHLRALGFTLKDIAVMAKESGHDPEQWRQIVMAASRV